MQDIAGWVRSVRAMLSPFTIAFMDSFCGFTSGHYRLPFIRRVVNALDPFGKPKLGYVNVGKDNRNNQEAEGG